MKITIDKNNVLKVFHKLKKSESYKINKSGNIQTISIFPKPQIVKGATNSTECFKFIPFFDYDDTPKEIVLEDYYYLQNRWKLGPGYLFENKKNSFHVICLTTFNYEKVQEIINASRCDSRYKSMNNRNFWRSWVLRLSNKKGSKKARFKQIIGETINLDSEVSESHLNLLNKLYKLPVIAYSKLDGGKLIKFHTYETSQ